MGKNVLVWQKNLFFLSNEPELLSVWVSGEPELIVIDRAFKSRLRDNREKSLYDQDWIHPRT